MVFWRFFYEEKVDFCLILRRKMGLKQGVNRKTRFILKPSHNALVKKIVKKEKVKKERKKKI